MRMTRMPWDITREMFLDEAEMEGLLGHLRQAVAGRSGRDRAAAQLDRLIVECLAFSGLRSSEFCRLTLADTVVGHGLHAFVVAGPGKERRTVFLPAHVVKLVADYVAHVRPTLLPDGVRADDLRQALVFGEHGQAYERTGLYRRVVRILTEAGLGARASVQLLRHTYGYLAYLRTGGNLLFVQRQLGHAHPMVTVVYAKFVRESYADLADAVGAGKAATKKPSPRRTGAKPERSRHASH
jgi:integrase